MRKPIFVRPKAGLQMRKEDGTPMPADGCSVPDIRYYRRRIADGDLTLVKKPKTSSKKETE